MNSLSAVDIVWRDENMAELLHKPTGCGKRLEGNTSMEPIFFCVNTAKLSSSICLPVFCFFLFVFLNDLDQPQFVENKNI